MKRIIYFLIPLIVCACAAGAEQGTVQGNAPGVAGDVPDVNKDVYNAGADKYDTHKDVYDTGADKYDTHKDVYGTGADTYDTHKDVPKLTPLP